MHDESTSWIGYEAHIKVGDAVVTPDGELWVIDEMRRGKLALVSASREDAEAPVIEDDHLVATKTIVPKAMVTKVADARNVVRSRT
jgi:hypothetical protein